MIIALLFTIVSFTGNHSIKAKESSDFQEKLTSVQSENPNVIVEEAKFGKVGDLAIVNQPVESASNQTNEDISDKDEVTFAQQFPNTYTAEVVAKKVWKKC
ncbi:hypothetical protein AZF37_07930 [endosymbiont 'TC1' of Trimyema compressum]|uniref:hypothetical protein n=1 Tax=endosymbiont 'TC1' of Trimyema compressum TaxID=243899 RepID=UPI0007F130A9|nr:hypothetical protein [endosymbiont 'TC1' of Trimyema compressum]AMP21099.1 hypothetical protein AZF37_07930 [endosymbiont 'TC1' of Trimyema compressum]